MDRFGIRRRGQIEKGYAPIGSIQRGMTVAAPHAFPVRAFSSAVPIVRDSRGGFRRAYRKRDRPWIAADGGRVEGTQGRTGCPGRRVWAAQVGATRFKRLAEFRRSPAGRHPRITIME